MRLDDYQIAEKVYNYADRLGIKEIVSPDLIRAFLKDSGLPHLTLGCLPDGEYLVYHGRLRVGVGHDIYTRRIKDYFIDSSL
jgi:hypothetical protein